MGEEPLPLGTGKIFVFHADDLKKEPVALGEVATLKPAVLTYKDDDSQPSYSNKGFTATGTCAMEGPAPELKQLMDGPRLVSVTMQQKLERMPRKKKKAYRSGYRRDTKWKRKVLNYVRRTVYTIPQAEIVVTKAQHDRLAAMLSQEIEISINPIKNPNNNEKQNSNLV